MLRYSSRFSTSLNVWTKSGRSNNNRPIIANGLDVGDVQKEDYLNGKKIIFIEILQHY
jgi:hypothetical protein